MLLGVVERFEELLLASLQLPALCLVESDSALKRCRVM
jgi:hypothetical protein